MTNHDHVISSRDHLSEFKQKTFNIVTYFQINILFHDAYDTLNILLYSINLFFFSVLQMPNYDLKTQFGPKNDPDTSKLGKNSLIGHFNELPLPYNYPAKGPRSKLADFGSKCSIFKKVHLNCLK